MLTEYGENHTGKNMESERHHEQIPSVQKTLLAQTKSVTDVIEELGNPFADTRTYLHTLDSKLIMPDSVVHTIRTAEDTCKAQHYTFVAERLNSKDAAFNDTVHKNNLPLLTSKSGKKLTKSTSKICNLQNDVHLFSRMYISCQTRDSDMDAFFEHENHAWTPSLVSNGMMHKTSKSDLMERLEAVVPKSESVPDVDVKIVDGGALLHILDPKKPQVSVKTFNEYAQLVFLPYIERMLQDVVRIDVVWDTYMEDSLKAQTRMNRGSGNHIRVSNSTNIPVDWKSFLRCDANKDSLFHLLADAIREFHPHQRKQVISTYGQNDVSSAIADLSDLSCTHEEADTWLLFHASHSFHQGFTKLMIHATDTDVVVLAIAV